jgi:hypothetical protein
VIEMDKVRNCLRTQVGTYVQALLKQFSFMYRIPGKGMGEPDVGVARCWCRKIWILMMGKVWSGSVVPGRTLAPLELGLRK